MTEKESLVLLNMVEGVGPRTILRVKDLFSDLSSIFGSSQKELSEKLGISSETARRVIEAPSKLNLNEELEFIGREKIQVISLWEKEYPPRLKEIYDPPPVLYVKGKVDFTPPSISLVGARHSTYYGNQTAFRLSLQLAACGITVTSGLARGIDTHAHRGALMAKGATAGVMGCGFRHFYPKENKALADLIIEKGCLISEFPTNVPPLSMNFPRRNRIISGLSLGVVVVEAAKSSGSLITAEFAMEQGRAVFAVPGQIDSPSSSGTLGLIKDGARMVETVNDIFEELGLEKQVMESTEPSSETLAGSPEEGHIFKLIRSDPMSIDEVFLHARMDTAKVLSLLMRLEVKRLIKQLPGKYYVRA